MELHLTLKKQSSASVAGGGENKVNALARYLELIVDPTFAEFKRDPTSVRRAYLSCVVIYHAIDRAAFPAKPRALLEDWRKQSLEFKLVETVALSFKHVKSDDEKRPLPKDT